MCLARPTVCNSHNVHQGRPRATAAGAPCVNTSVCFRICETCFTQQACIFDTACEALHTNMNNMRVLRQNHDTEDVCAHANASSGSAQGATLAAMAASSKHCYAKPGSHTIDNPDWSAVVTHDLYWRRLTTSRGNTQQSGLPVAAYKKELTELMNYHAHLGVSAPPGSGQSQHLTMCAHFDHCPFFLQDM